MSGIPLYDEKCAGALVTAAVGDALGWPNERSSYDRSAKQKVQIGFQDWMYRAGGQFRGHFELIRAGEYSDDTQLILAVARSLLSGQAWEKHFCNKELPFWLKYQRGGGRAILQAAKSWENRVEPWRGKDAKSYFMAGGNGAAMRILPHVIFHIHDHDFLGISEEVAIDAIQTHGHPRAILGALCYSYALYYLFKKENTLSFGELTKAVLDNKSNWGQFPVAFSEGWMGAAQEFAPYDYLETWYKTLDSMSHMLKMISDALDNGVLDIETQTLSDLGCFDNTVKGAGDIAAVGSIYLASKYANNPTLGVKSAVNALGADTDTLASMTGGLLGALCGLSWLPPEWMCIQDYDCLIRMAGFLHSRQGFTLVKEYTSFNQAADTAWQRSPIGLYQFIETTTFPFGKTGSVTISKYVTKLGQTIYVRSYSSEQTNQPRKRSVNTDSARVCSLKIDSTQAAKLCENDALSKIKFCTVLKVLGLYSQGVSSPEAIRKQAKLKVTKDTIAEILNLIVFDP